MAEKFGDAHLEIISTGESDGFRVEGRTTNVIFAWMRLTAVVAEDVGVPLTELLSMCAALGEELKSLSCQAETIRIDLSRPHKGDAK